MRRCRFGYHRCGLRFKRKVLFAVVVFLFLFVVLFTENRVPSFRAAAMEAALERFAQEKISENVPEYLSERTAQYEEKIVLLDTYHLNQLKNDLTKRLQRELTGKTVIWVPFGSLTGSTFLHGRGLNIPIVFSVSGTVDISFVSNLCEAGINRTKYSVEMVITGHLYSLSAQAAECVSVQSCYPLYEAVLEGEIPSYVPTVR